jgi:uracil phosphoribosyltransferase
LPGLLIRPPECSTTPIALVISIKRLIILTNPDFFFIDPKLTSFFSRMDLKITVINHPVANHALTVLRDKSTTLAQFREACGQVVPCVLYEATKSFATRTKSIVTPLCEMEGSEILDDIVLVPILRAGISMVEPALRFLPFARIGYFGMQRDEETAIASTYYKKLPPLNGANVILLDPMLATGGSADYAIQEMKEHNPKSLSFCCIVAAPEGVRRLNEKYKDMSIYTIALDDHLDERKYIVPGLGDFGDRFHGTVF